MPKSTGTVRTSKYRHPLDMGFVPTQNPQIEDCVDNLIQRFDEVAPDLHIAKLSVWELDSPFRWRRGLVEVTFGPNRDLHQIRVWSRNFVRYQPSDNQISKALARFNVRCQGDNLSFPMQCHNVAQYLLRDPDGTQWAGCWNCREVAQGPRYNRYKELMGPEAYDEFVAREMKNHPVKEWQA